MCRTSEHGAESDPSQAGVRPEHMEPASTHGRTLAGEEAPQRKGCAGCGAGCRRQRLQDAAQGQALS